MKKFTDNAGVILILLGTTLLVTTRIGKWSTHNWLLLIGLLLIVAGVFVHIRSIKHESRY